MATPILTRGAYAEPATSLAFKTGSWRVQRPVHRHRPAPCHHACPAGEDAQAYLARIEEGNLRAAWETLVRVNPLPAITGRVCHHPCETACNRAQYDDPIAIHNVERFLGDEAIRAGWDYPIGTPPSDASRVAVVGAGPAGLAAAYHCQRLGYQVTVFDTLPDAGGTLRTAIPQYRLPRETLDGEIGRLLATGMRFEGHRTLGRDVSLAELHSDYQAVFLGPGCQRSREWSVDGAIPSDLHVGLDLLKEWVAIGSAPEAMSTAIVGAGNTAIDLARVLKRSGIPEVHVISHKVIPGPDVPPDDAMPAIEREIRQGLEEGVILHEHRGIRRLILRGERVVGLELVHMKKLPQTDGRLKRIAFEGTESVLHVEQVIPAIGQVVDPLGMESLLGHHSYFRVDQWGRIYGHPEVFTGGDARGDRGTVSEAIGDGRRAAEAIHRTIQGHALAHEERSQPIEISELNLSYFEHGRRPAEGVLPVEARHTCEEIDTGLDRSQVVGESVRCFSCGNCLACDNCWTLCPDASVLKTHEQASEGEHYQFDYDYCKGCGLCAKECPCGYITMVDEP